MSEKSVFKCPKCGNSSLTTAICDDGIVVVSCDHQFADGRYCDYYDEMKQLPIISIKNKEVKKMSMDEWRRRRERKIRFRKQDFKQKSLF